jgi:hypothetical protein
MGRRTGIGHLDRFLVACSFATVALVLSVVSGLANAGAPYGNVKTVAPQPVRPGGTLTVTTSNWESGAGVDFYWNGNFATSIRYANADAGGLLNTTITVPSPLADGTYQLQACEPTGAPGSACAGTSPAFHAVLVQNPPPPPVSPPPSPVPTTVPTVSIPPLALTPTQRPAPRVSAPTPVPTPSSIPSPSPTAVVEVIDSPTPPPPAPSSQVYRAPPAQPQAIAYDPASETSRTVSLAVAAFTLLTLTGAGGLAIAGAGGVLGVSGHPSGARGPGAGKVATASVKYLQGGAEAVARGDRSWTWRIPGTSRFDALSFALPRWLGPRSPLLARLVTDGSYLRAAFGVSYMFLPAAGLVLGLLAASDATRHVVPVPTLTLVVLLLVLGVVDAFAGFVGVLVYGVTLGLGGHLASAPDLRLLIGLGGTWFVTPLLAAAARPLRRVPARTMGHLWDHGADFVVASLIGAWAVQKIVQALPGLAGVRVGLAANANLCALVVLLALVGRVAAEALAANLYPRRLAAVQPQMVLDPPIRQRLLALAGRAAIFTFIAVAFVGLRWQLWVGLALFAVPQLLSIFGDRLPNHPRLYHYLPRGILRTVIMLLVASWVGGLVLHMSTDPHELVADAFAVVAVPGAALSLISVIGRDGAETTLTWWHRAAGTAVLLVGIAFVFGTFG